MGFCIVFEGLRVTLNSNSFPVRLSCLVILVLPDCMVLTVSFSTCLVGLDVVTSLMRLMLSSEESVSVSVAVHSLAVSSVSEESIFLTFYLSRFVDFDDFSFDLQHFSK